MENEEKTNPTTESTDSSMAVTLERIEAANKKKEELLEREEKLEALKRLGGESEAGSEPEEEKEETPKEYADRVMRNDL